MPRDNNPTHTSSDDPNEARDNMPTTHKHGGRSAAGATEACPSCGAFDRTSKQVPTKGDEPRTAEVCDECGHVFGDEDGLADKA